MAPSKKLQKMVKLSFKNKSVGRIQISKLSVFLPSLMTLTLIMFNRLYHNLNDIRRKIVISDAEMADIKPDFCLIIRQKNSQNPTC